MADCQFSEKRAAYVFNICKIISRRTNATLHFRNTKHMNWLILIIAGLFEVGFTTCLGKAKASNGSTATLWLIGFFVSLTMSMYLLYKATQTLPIGTAYAVWTGVGAVGTVIMGFIFFKEPAEFWRLFFIATLIASIVGLKFVSSES